jgi:hypothetical protein
MSLRQLLLLPALVCSTLLLAGALDRQTLYSDSARPALFRPRGAESAADALLDKAVDAVSPISLEWLDTRVWQKKAGQHEVVEGRYIVGPHQRMRLDLKVRLGGNTGFVRAISDGQSLRQARWQKGQQPKLAVAVLPKLEGDTDPRELWQVRENFLHEQGFGGLWPLLRAIRSGLRRPRKQAGLWQGKSVIKVAGAWDASQDRLCQLPPSCRARRCNLYLDAATLWPHRIEWIGSDRPDDHPTLLLQMEFRDPIRNHPLSETDCARVFGEWSDGRGLP